MFGKKSKSSNDRFVIAQGRAAGNLKGAGAPFNVRKPMSDSAGTPMRGDHKKQKMGNKSATVTAKGMFKV